MFTIDHIPSTGAILSAYTALAASTVLIRTVINEVKNMTNQIIPEKIQEKILSKLGIVIGIHSSQICMVIEEMNGASINEMFEASEIYLQSKISSSVKKMKLYKGLGDDKLLVSVGKGETMIDTFDGMEFKWLFICTETQQTSNEEGYFSSERIERKSFELSFNKKYMVKALTSYLPHVLELSNATKISKKIVNLHSLVNYACESVILNHPSTFETLAMDSTVKEALKLDLDTFLERRDYYRRVGKAWKRGYLLYGPPGTGKSSLIAAMANYLKFDIYDMELASLRNNAELRRLIGNTKNRSILVIEDIDCSVDLSNRERVGYEQNESQLTLSGLLNFIDGLWSTCGDERIIVFTTNHKERLDPALLRPGRMDMHIHMSYCTMGGFKVLAFNYLGIKNHCKFIEIENLLNEVEATPAEIAEQLMRNKETEGAILLVLDFLGKKKKKLQGSEVNDKENESGIKPKIEGKVRRNYKRKVRSGVCTR